MNSSQLKERIHELTGKPLKGQLTVSTDTTNFTEISRDDVLDLEGSLYLIRGNTYEARFTLEGYPKFWVKSALDIYTGEKKIIKCVFYEEFFMQIGILNIKCFRSPEKESEVLDMVRDNYSFMQGETYYDTRRNPVRVIDFIQGNNFYNFIQDIEVSHEEYFHNMFPGILLKLRSVINAIHFIHKNKLFHGDIRNDHIIIERETGEYRWIDFDLNQHFSDFDVWSLGNILLFAAGKGEHTFSDIRKEKKLPEKIIDSLNENDASAFFKYRIMNLKKLFPYIPQKLNDILMHFSVKTDVFYDTAEQIIEDVDEILSEMGMEGHGSN